VKVKVGFPETKWQWFYFLLNILFWVSWTWMLFWLRNKEIVCQEYCKNLCPEFEPFFLLNYSKNITMGELLDILNKTG